MEGWLVFMVFGLLLDILGIWIIARPLLRKVFENEEGWNKRVQEANANYEKETKNLADGVIEPANRFDLARVEAYLYRVLNFMYKGNNKQRRLTYIGLFIITLGFFFQIIGNILQSI